MSRLIRSLAWAVVCSLISLAIVTAAITCTNAGAPITPAATATAIPPPAPTATPIPAPTATPTPTPTATPAPTPTATAVPTPTATAIPTATPTNTPVPTATPRPTATPIPTATPRPTAAPTTTLRSCRISSKGRIEWEQEPVISNGYLVASGRTKGSAFIQSAPPQFRTGGQLFPPFNLSNYLQGSDRNPGRLKAVGNIWPHYMASRFDDAKIRLFAEEGDYRVTFTEFHVRAKVPAELLTRDIRLVFAVWPANTHSTSTTLDHKCVRYE